MREWLKEQPGSMADTVREAVDFYREYADIRRSFERIDTEKLRAFRDELARRANEPTDHLDRLSDDEREVKEAVEEADRTMLVIQLMMLDAMEDA